MARHHYVPRFILRRFANDREQIRVVEREDLSRTHLSSVRKTATATDYYSIPTEEVEPDFREGHEPDRIEESLASIEDQAAEHIHAIREGSWRPTEESFYRLARFVAFQMCRGPGFRRDYSGIATVAARRFVHSNIAEDRVRAYLKETHGDPTDAEVEAFAEEARTMDFEMIPSDVHALQESMRFAIEHFLPHLLERSPQILRFETPALMTSDRGVGLWGPDAPHPRSVEAATARAVFIPLDRYTALALTRRKGFSDTYVKNFWARHINLSVSDRATSWLYHHPDDDPLKAMDLLPPRRLVSAPTGSRIREDGALVVQNVQYWK
jgi:hypothetical protein